MERNRNIDELFVNLTHAADHSALWFAIAGALGLATRSILTPRRAAQPRPSPTWQRPPELILVTSPHAGHSRLLPLDFEDFDDH